MMLKRLTIANYRVLRRVELGPLTPLTVLLGVPGSGKSTVLDALEFVSECQDGLGPAWDRRHGQEGLVSQDADGPLEIGLVVSGDDGELDYRVTVSERDGKPVATEVLSGTKLGSGSDRLLVLDRDCDAPGAERIQEFVAGWRIFRLSADRVRRASGDSGRTLALDGRNLTEVIGGLERDHPRSLERICSTLGRMIPHAVRVHVAADDDGPSLVVTDRRGRPTKSRFTDSGTLVLLAYLVALFGPQPPTLAGLRDPERNLHPRLLAELAEELRSATPRTQLVVTTHSPQLLDGLRPREVWVMDRGDDGYAVAARASDIRGIREFVDEGAVLGQLWTEGHLELGR